MAVLVHCYQQSNDNSLVAVTCTRSSTSWLRQERIRTLKIQEHLNYHSIAGECAFQALLLKALGVMK